MTLCLAWVRKVGSIREMIVAADSRLSGGQSWDGNPKILLLPRSDTVVAFSGATDDAYPLMLQVYNAINMHEPARNRYMDFTNLCGHLLRVLNHSRKFISDLPYGQSNTPPAGAEFLICGYSVRLKEFFSYRIYFRRDQERFVITKNSFWPDKKDKYLTLTGDREAREEAINKIKASLLYKNKFDSGSFDMEPFESLRDIIRDGRIKSVGGPIQLVKIYENLNAVPIGVYWPSKKSGRVSVLGRPLMDYEKTDWGVLDPDNPGRAWPMKAPYNPTD